MGRRKLTDEERLKAAEKYRSDKLVANRRRRENPEYRAKELAKSRETRRNWSRERRDQANATSKASYKRRSPERIQKQARYMKEYVLQSKYGLSVDGWNELFEKQGRKCACCGAAEPGTLHGWSTDHDHTMEKNVRGILCHLCNIRIGQLGDTLEQVKLTTAMYLTYLEEHSPQTKGYTRNEEITIYRSTRRMRK
jgi:hypothetical protein